MENDHDGPGKDAAFRSVRDLNGVRGVTNNIVVQPRANIGDVKNKIEAAFKRSAEIDARRIAVSVHDGKVVLSGNVRSWLERQEAERLVPVIRRAAMTGTAAIDVTQEAIQVLLDRPGGAGMIVSCYADISVSAGLQPYWPLHLKNEAGGIVRRLAGDPHALAQFTKDLAIVRQALSEPGAQRARGMAVFSAAGEGLFRAFALGVPVRNRLVLDEEPYLVPLLEAMHRQRRYLVVVTDSHRGRLYEAAWGHTHLVGEIEEDVPRRQRSAGERWGKQQATIARHREDHLLHYRKALAHAIEDAWPGAPFRGLILLGDHKTLEALRPDLPPALANRIVHAARYSWARQEPRLDAKVQEVLDDAFREHDARLLTEFDQRLRERHLVAAGAQEVLNALRNGQVGYPGFVLLEPDRGDMAARCTRCRSVFTTLHAVCPFCDGACAKVNLWQEILLFCARHNITAHTVEAGGELSRNGGVAAVLSRPEPWASTPRGIAAAVAGRG